MKIPHEKTRKSSMKLRNPHEITISFKKLPNISPAALIWPNKSFMGEIFLGEFPHEIFMGETEIADSPPPMKFMGVAIILYPEKTFVH